MFAGLQANKKTTVHKTGPLASRLHRERITQAEEAQKTSFLAFMVAEASKLWAKVMCGRDSFGTVVHSYSAWCYWIHLQTHGRDGADSSTYPLMTFALRLVWNRLSKFTLWSPEYIATVADDIASAGVVRAITLTEEAFNRQLAYHKGNISCEGLFAYQVGLAAWSQAQSENRRNARNAQVSTSDWNVLAESVGAKDNTEDSAEYRLLMREVKSITPEVRAFLLHKQAGLTITEMVAEEGWTRKQAERIRLSALHFAERVQYGEEHAAKGHAKRLKAYGASAIGANTNAARQKTFRERRKAERDAKRAGN